MAAAISQPPRQCGRQGKWRRNYSGTIAYDRRLMVFTLSAGLLPAGNVCAWQWAYRGPIEPVRRSVGPSCTTLAGPHQSVVIDAETSRADSRSTERHPLPPLRSQTSGCMVAAMLDTAVGQLGLFFDCRRLRW